MVEIVQSLNFKLRKYEWSCILTLLRCYSAKLFSLTCECRHKFIDTVKSTVSFIIWQKKNKSVANFKTINLICKFFNTFFANVKYDLPMSSDRSTWTFFRFLLFCKTIHVTRTQHVWWQIFFYWKHYKQEKIIMLSLSLRSVLNFPNWFT